MDEDEIEEEVDELVDEFSDHLRASLLVTRSLDEAELTIVLGEHLGLLRLTAEALARYAMVLRRQPRLAEEIANALDRAAASINLAIGRDDEQEETA